MNKSLERPVGTPLAGVQNPPRTGASPVPTESNCESNGNNLKNDNPDQSQQNINKLLGLMGLMRKAGKLALGYDESISEAKKGHARCVIISPDISPKTEKELRYHLKDVRINILKAPADFGLAVGKAVKIIAVNDAGFARSATKMINEFKG